MILGPFSLLTSAESLTLGPFSVTTSSEGLVLGPFSITTNAPTIELTTVVINSTNHLYLFKESRHLILNQWSKY